MKRTAMIGIIVAVVAMMSLAGYGYAYSGSLSVGNNGVSGTAHSVDIRDADGNPITEFDIPAPNHFGTTVTTEYFTISGKVIVNMDEGSADLRAWLHLPTYAWIYIESVTVTLDGTPYAMTQGGDTGRTCAVIENVSNGTHDYSLRIDYTDTVPYAVDSDNHDIFVDGGRFTFAAGSDDPLS